MGHYMGLFRGGWILWIILFLAFSGAFGKIGIPGFFIPLILLWFCLPAVFRAGRSRSRRMRWARRAPRPERQRGTPVADPEPVPQPLMETRRRPTTGRSLSGLPAACSACGGPVDRTTVTWRGDIPLCGYCGTGLRHQS